MKSNLIAKQLETAEHVLVGLFEKRVPSSLIFSGPPGFGKSYLLRKFCKKYGIDWAPIRPSTKGLVDHLRQHGRKRVPLIFDDFDALFGDSAMLQTLKIVLDSHDDRVLSNDVRGHNHIKPFRVTSPAVFLTNKNFSNPAHFSKRVWASDIPALKDRSTIIPLSFDPAAMLAYTLELAPVVLGQIKERGAGGYDRFLSRAEKCELVAHLRENSKRYNEISPRTLARMGKLRLAYSDPQLWQDVREAQLKPTWPPARTNGCSSGQNTGSGSPQYYGIDEDKTTFEWYTPEYIFVALECQFDLDPASPGRDVVPWIPVFHQFTEGGLERDWFGFVWLNPPYGKNLLHLWVDKFIQHGNGIALIPERTSTQWWQKLAARADLMLCVSRRITFINAAGEPSAKPFPLGSMLVAIGEPAVRGLMNAHRNGLGSLVKPVAEAAD